MKTCDPLPKGACQQLVIGTCERSDGKNSRLTVPQSHQHLSSVLPRSSYCDEKGECCRRSYYYLVSKLLIGLWWWLHGPFHQVSANPNRKFLSCFSAYLRELVTYGKIKGGTQKGRSDGKKQQTNSTPISIGWWQLSSVTIFIGSSTWVMRSGWSFISTTICWPSDFCRKPLIVH